MQRGGSVVWCFVGYGDEVDGAAWSYWVNLLDGTGLGGDAERSKHLM